MGKVGSKDWGVQGVGLLGWRVIRGGGEVSGWGRGSVGWGVVGDGGEGVFKRRSRGRSPLASKWPTEGGHCS